MNVFTPPKLKSVLRYRLTDDDRQTLARVEAQRPILETDETPTGFDHAPTVGQLAKIASVQLDRAWLLYASVKVWQPQRVLEMGTCCGMSGAMIQSAGVPEFISLEGNRPAADAASALWGRLGFGGSVVVGDFADTFESALHPAPDLVFVDGNHYEAPTWAYFQRLVEVCEPGSLLIFDDVDWSVEMRRVWSRIKDASKCSATASRTGFVVL